MPLVRHDLFFFLAAFLLVLVLLFAPTAEENRVGIATSNPSATPAFTQDLGGASLLTTSRFPAISVNDAEQLSDVPTRYLVEFAEPSVLAMSASAPSSAKKGVSLQTYDARLSQTAAERIAMIRTSIPGARVLRAYALAFNGLLVDATPSEAAALISIDGVIAVHPDQKVRATLMDSIPLIGAPAAWNQHDAAGQPLTGAGVTIAILDTGIDYLHPDLGGCFGPGCKVAAGFDFINNDTDPMDDHGHGTHVAATAAGNGTLRGVAPGATLHAYKILDEHGGGSWSGIIAALEAAADPDKDGDPSDHVDIISMSLGGEGDPDDLISRAVDDAVAAGLTVVVAAGNSGPSAKTITSPGTARRAITVGATDKEDMTAWFSSRGPVTWPGGSITKPDLVAPGVSICAAEHSDWLSERRCLDERHITIDGTSMATPHVAGAAALLTQLHPSWTPAEFKAALRASAKPLIENLAPGALNDEHGYGRLDVAAAIRVQEPCPLAIETSGTVSGSVELLLRACPSVANLTLTLQRAPNHIISSHSLLPLAETRFLLDTTTLEEGGYTMILDATNSVGERFRDVAYLDVDNFRIMTIGDRFGYVTGNFSVDGAIDRPFDAYKVEYDASGNGTWRILCEGRTPQLGRFCVGDASHLANGKYSVRLAIHDGAWRYDLPTAKIVLQELMDGWPVQLHDETLPSCMPLAEDFGRGHELLSCTPAWCGGGWCGGYQMHFLSSNASSRLVVANDYLTTFPALVPGTRPALLLRDYARMALLDADGVILPGWPNILPHDGFAERNIVADLDENGAPELYVLALERSSPPRYVIHGYAVNGEPLPGFPFTFTDAVPRSHAVALDQLLLLPDKEHPRLAVVHSPFDEAPEGGMVIMDLTLTVIDIRTRSMTHTLIEMPHNASPGGLSAATGDIDGDGQHEILLGLGLIDMDLFQVDKYNPAAYWSRVLSFDVAGKEEGVLLALEGRLLEHLILGRFGEARVAASFANTWATDDGNLMTLLLGPEGVVANATFFSQRSILNSIYAADLDPTPGSELLVTHRPRFFDGTDSGILLYSSQGRLLREIPIPTFGDVDDFFSLVITDADGDGSANLFLSMVHVPLGAPSSLFYNRAFLLDLGTPLGARDWPLYLRDAQRSGCFDCASPFVLETEKPLLISVKGNGAVSANGELCASECTFLFPLGAEVELSPMPGAGASFQKWGGDCKQERGICLLVMDGEKSVSADFVSRQRPVRRKG